MGPEAQRAAIADFARRQGIGVVEWFEDRLCGAKELEQRPGLLAALEALERQRAGQLLILRRDRLARDAAVAALLDRHVQHRGARVVCADGIANGDSPAETFMRTMLDGAAEFERALIGLRTKAALGAKRARNERVGMVPYGFRVGTDGRHLEPDPVEQAVMARVQGLRQEGLSLRGIVKSLEQDGVRSRKGTTFQLTQVLRLVHRQDPRRSPRQRT